MDRTIKFLLGVIAASLLMLNLQLAGGSLVKDAHASVGEHAIADSLNRIAAAIRDIDCGR